MPTERVWREWKDDGNGDTNCDSRFNVKYLVHAAKPASVTSPWVRSHLIPLTFAPKWNDYRVIRAVLELIREAVKDESVTHCVVVTESCVPLSSFER